MGFEWDSIGSSEMDAALDGLGVRPPIRRQWREVGFAPEFIGEPVEV